MSSFGGIGSGGGKATKEGYLVKVVVNESGGGKKRTKVMQEDGDSASEDNGAAVENIVRVDETDQVDEVVLLDSSTEKTISLLPEFGKLVYLDQVIIEGAPDTYGWSLVVNGTTINSSTLVSPARQHIFVRPERNTNYNNTAGSTFGDVGNALLGKLQQKHGGTHPNLRNQFFRLDNVLPVAECDDDIRVTMQKPTWADPNLRGRFVKFTFRGFGKVTAGPQEGYSGSVESVDDEFVLFYRQKNQFK